MQVADQTLTLGNKALAISFEKQFPVRVVRGVSKKSKFAPKIGYRYDGLFLVSENLHEKGKSGFTVWRFRLEKLSNILKKDNDVFNDSGSINVNLIPSIENTVRKEFVINRIIRETKVSQGIKKLYKNTCQICGIQLETSVSGYSEAAHIKGLGKPHNGPDSIDNILCLCPNHHTMLDFGMIAITEDFNVFGFENRKLFVHPNHKINIEFLNYHRNHHFKRDIK